MKLTLVGRPGCHLCEEFEHALRAAYPQVEIEHGDVDSRADWLRRYGMKIPVLLAPDGLVLCETFFDPAALAAIR
ncbi:MAG TPA: glutaredoxin family protein [Nevskiaceae bacterium]|nr:glutaredoxin family protein [Nevskiaceae bacterium]